MRTKIWLFFAVLLVAVLGGAAFWFRSTQLKPEEKKPEPGLAIPSLLDAGKPAAAPLPARTELPVRKAADEADASQGKPDASAGSSSEPAMSTSSERISEIIADPSLDFAGASAQLVKLLPDLDEDGQEEAGHHIVNLTDDEGLVQLAPMLVENRMPSPALEVVYAELLNRPHPVGMPILASIADRKDHPKKTDAVETLEFLYGQPPAGVKWADWVQSKVVETPES